MTEARKKIPQKKNLNYCVDLQVENERLDWLLRDLKLSEIWEGIYRS